MKIVIFGLTISSAWGNGHATLLRGLFRALHNRGHRIHFFERDTPYYAGHRDADSFPFATLHLYSDWNDVRMKAREEVMSCDAGIVTSYCADGAEASRLVLELRPARTVFYDMDTPVTLSRLEQGETVPYLPPGGLGDFDLVLSYTGGKALDYLRIKLNAKCVSPLYGWVDPTSYFRAEPVPCFGARLSYLGTHSADRQAAFEELFMKPASELENFDFVVGGAMYKDVHRWPANVRYFEHVTPADHPAFYSSSPVTLNITRASMAGMGYCPSGRVFEASACGTAIVSDWWDGLDTFFRPHEEILIASRVTDVLQALRTDDETIARIGRRAQEHTLDCHTADIRAQSLIHLLETLPVSAATGQEERLSLVEEA